MSDTIGRITVPAITPSGTFPLKSRYPHGIALKRPVVTHTFGSANAKIEQRFYVGTPAERYIFSDPALARAGRTSLRNFWEARKGAEGAFTYPVPQPDHSFGNKTVYFENVPLTLQELTDAITSVGITMCEIPDPASAPTYALNSTVTRFPSGTLATALLDQVQEIIPLVRIRVQDGAVPDMFLSDRRVTIGTQLYLPRLLRIGEPGSEALITQSIAVDGNAPSDDVTLAFGNADRVMTQVANDTNLTWARVELSLFHVGTGIKLDLWAGYIVPGGWHSDFGPEFTIHCSDILSALTLSSPVGLASRTCWRRLGQDGCLYAVGSGLLDLVHFPSASTTTCDFGYNTPNGCMAHKVQQSFGGVYATPQGVTFLNKSNAGGGALLRATSLVNDTLFGEPIPEIWHNDEGVPQWGLPVKCKIAAGRDESDYYIALGLIGKGPLGALTAPGMWDSNGDGVPDTFVGSTLDGQPNHGYQVTSAGTLKPGANAMFGLRAAPGSDPAGVHDYFSLGRVAAAIGIGAARGWYTNPADSSPMHEVADAGSAYNEIYAAGLAFLEIRRSDQPDVQVSLPGTHELIARVSQGLTGYTWTAPGSRTTAAGCTDPFWVAINTFLRACGQIGASAATQEQYFDVAAAISAAAISGATVAKVFGAGTEKQFQFKGTVDQVRPTRDWIQLILNNAAGYFTWSFGKLRVGCRANASAASAFTAGNMIFGSLSLEPVKPHFEKLTIKFADQEYQFAANTVDYTDKDYAARYNRVANPLSADMELTGSTSKSQTARLAVCRAREELGGAVAAEQDAARNARWASTVLALETEAGQVVSVADADVPSGTGNFRVLRWTLNRDWSISYEAKTVIASMYDLTVGPKPADVAALPVPGESATDWNPNYETPVSGDPLFSAKGFGIKQVYEAAADQGALASVEIYGDQPADRILQFKARRELVSGICAQVAASISTNTIALGGTLTVNAYVGRVISKLANASGSTAMVPIQDFTITANDAAGNFTVTPDPSAAGCLAGDLFTIRTKPTAFDATSFTDSGFINPYNPGGLTAGGNRGNLALVIAGTGAGQTPQTVADNTTTKVTVSPGWDVIPDATSVIVLVEASGQAPVQFDQAGGAANSFLGALPVPNYAAKVIRVEGYTQKAAVLGRIETAPFRELYIWGDPGSSGTSGTGPLALVYPNTPGQVGVPYSMTPAVSGGTTPYAFTIVSGSLSGTGLTFDGTTGKISGTPTTAGLVSVTIRVTDAAPTTADFALSIAVASPSGNPIVVGTSTTLPRANDITSLSVAPGLNNQTNFPYDKTTANGNHYASIAWLALSDAGCAGDPNAYRIIVTARDKDASGNYIGPEQTFWTSHVGAAAGSGNTYTFGPLDTAYGTDGYSYVRSGELYSVEFAVYVVNATDESPQAWSNTAAARLQNTIGVSGRVEVAVAKAVQDTAHGGRRAPLGTFDRVDRTNTGGGVQYDPRTGRLVNNNDNLAASLIQDPSFEFASPGYLGTSGIAPGWNWGIVPGSIIEIRNDGGNSASNYARLTGKDASLTQTITVQPGLTFYLSIAARSSNSGAAGHAVGIYVNWLDANNAVLSPYTTIIGTVSGYVSAWTANAASGYVTAPAGAAKAIIKISTSASEPALEYWDIDDVLMQAVIQQTANGQTTTTAPATYSGDYSALRTRSVTTLAESFYGKQVMFITGPAGENIILQVATPGVSFAMTDANGSGFGFGAVGSGNPYMQVNQAGVSKPAADNETITTSGGTRHVRSGLICLT